MRLRYLILPIFVLTPVVEIGLFFVVGKRIGIVPTLGLVIATAVVGCWLVVRQGRETWLELRIGMSNGRSPSVPLIHGALILVAGAFLLTPGFLTDAVGFALLVPPIREGLSDWFLSRLSSRWVVVR